MKLLIDADSLLYKFASIHQKDFDWGDSMSQVTDLDAAVSDLEDFIMAIREETNTDEYLMYLTGKTNFRYDTLPTYKHNRKGKDKPVLLPALWDYLMENHPTTVTNKIEADDACCIQMARKPGEYILAHIDKDLNQAVGTHYNWNTLDLYEITEKEANYFFYYQVLTGDAVDGYSGCPGIGPVKAKKILGDVLDECTPWATDEAYYKRIWEAIVETYETKGLTEADALVQARVAKMLDNKLWKNNEVILWEPTR